MVSGTPSQNSRRFCTVVSPMLHSASSVRNAWFGESQG